MPLKAKGIKIYTFKVHQLLTRSIPPTVAYALKSAQLLTHATPISVLYAIFNLNVLDIYLLHRWQIAQHEIC